MAPIPQLAKRYYYYTNTSNASRWAYLAILALIIVVGVLYICCANRRRMRSGTKPIRGTAWITPPSYFQSQAQQPYGNNLPTYTANVNPQQDYGYYDQEGKFVPSTQQQQQQQQQPYQEQQPQQPQEAYSGTNFQSENPYQQASASQTYQPTYQPADEEPHQYYRPPAGPPPARTK